MAVCQKQNMAAYKADAAITKGMGVKIGTDSKHVAKGAAATDDCIGVAQNTVTTAEDVVEVAMNGGGAKGLAGGTITAGQMVTTTTDGSLIATTSNADNVIGQALEDAVVGDYFNMNVSVGIV